jgi:hypothetical protein
MMSFDIADFAPDDVILTGIDTGMANAARQAVGDMTEDETKRAEEWVSSR